MKAFLFCPNGVVSALKQPFFSKNSKKDKHQNDVCLQSEPIKIEVAYNLYFYRLLVLARQSIVE